MDEDSSRDATTADDTDSGVDDDGALDDSVEESAVESNEGAVTDFDEQLEPVDDSPVEDAPVDGDADDVQQLSPDIDVVGSEPDHPHGPEPPTSVPPDVKKYEKFKKMDGATYDRVNEFLRDRTYITAREWAIARLCADFRTETGVEMTKIGENLPELVPFMTDTYTPQAVNQARSAFKDKVRTAGATFLYGAMCDFFTAEELDDMMYEVTEVAKFLLEVEGAELSVDEELDAEDRILSVMREVQAQSDRLRYDDVACPHCGEIFHPDPD